MATPPWLWFTATFDLADIENAPMSGRVECVAETPLYWTATGTYVPDATKDKGTYNGKVTFILPYTDQIGFTAGKGGAAVINWGYRFIVRPTRSKPITSETFVQVPQSQGAIVRIGSLVDIGAWPNAATPDPGIPVPPTNPTTGVYTETPPGSGIFRWSAT